MILQRERCVIALDIGGSSTKLALINQSGEMREWRQFPTQQPLIGTFIEQLIGAVRELRSHVSGELSGIAGAVAGFVDEYGTLLYNPNLPWLEGICIGAELADAFELRVHLEADSNAACAGEYLFGEGRDSSRFLCLTGGTGLGVGMIVNGTLLRTAFGCLGDAGHIIVSPNGPPCSCGGRGCAEVILSTVELGKQYAQAVGGSATFQDMVIAASKGEAHAVGLLNEAGHRLGIAAASLANIFFPDRIAIAGGLSQAGEPLLVAAAASFAAYGGTFPVARTTFVRASTSRHATLLGAAACFFLKHS